MSEPKYDEDLVNLRYLKRALGLTDEEAKDIYKYISRHYASKPQPPYYVGDTWIDGDIIYTCIKERLIGTYHAEDWATESGAKKEAEEKNRVFLRQPSNYRPGDMWILQSDDDHKAGKKGEMLIATNGRYEYDEGDWVNMLGYGTIRSINEVANNINDALIRLGLNKEEGIVTIFYSETIPTEAVLDDLWYVTETINEYTKGTVYKYNGTSWEIVEDKLAIVAFEEANEARLVADGKIKSFYSEEEPTQNIGVGDIWTNTSDNKLYRYNGTKWIAVYDTNISEMRTELNKTIERTTKLETDLGEINASVKQIETTIETNLVTNETFSETVKELNSNLDIKVGEISSSVSELTTYVQDNYSTTEETKTLIGQTSTSILETVEASYATNTALSNTEKTLKASLELKLNTADLISEINASADQIKLKAGRLIIDSGNFQLYEDGNISCIGGTIGGFTLGSNIFSADLKFGKKYTYNDLLRVYDIIRENIIPTQEDYEKYDIFKSGKIEFADYNLIYQLYNNQISGDGKFILKTNESENAITLQDTQGNNCVTIGRFGSYMNNLKVDNIYPITITARRLTVNDADIPVVESGITTLPGYKTGHLSLYSENNGRTISLFGETGIINAVTMNATAEMTVDGGLVMYALAGSHRYQCYWTDTQLQFWVDGTNIGTLSDKRLKNDIKDIDEDLIKAIEEIEMKQFKIANRNGLISFGILAQDLIEIFEKYNKNPFDYEIVQKTQYRLDDETIYYTIDYEQYLILKAKAQEKKIEDLRKRIEILEGEK